MTTGEADDESVVSRGAASLDTAAPPPPLAWGGAVPGPHVAVRAGPTRLT
jgi:hypothetical protein